jgi:hypothetical protein
MYLLKKEVREVGFLIFLLCYISVIVRESLLYEPVYEKRGLMT